MNFGRFLFLTLNTSMKSYLQIMIFKILHIYIILLGNLVFKYKLKNCMYSTLKISVYWFHIPTFGIYICSGLSFTIWISFLNTTVWVFSHSCSIWEKNIFLTTRIFNCFDSILLDSLNGSISENAFFLTVCEDTFYCTIREAINKKIVRYKVWKYLTYIISLVPSPKCFSIYMFWNLNT